MRAAVLHELGPRVQVLIEMRPVPRPGPGQVLVRVAAAAVNPRDWMIRAGIYPFRMMLPRRPFVMGSDFAGTIETLGRDVHDLTPGQRVFGMQRAFGAFGACAEFVVVGRDLIAPTPDRLGDTEAAGIPLAALTAWHALFRYAALQAGERVLVTGASGGVGMFAVQLAAATGAAVTGVCGAPNMVFVESLGAVEVLDYRRPDFMADHPRWDVVFDAAGRWSYRWFRSRMAAGGRYVTTVPRMPDLGAAVISPVTKMLRPGRPTASLVLVKAGGEPLLDIARRAAAGALQSHVDTVYPLAGINQALDHSRTMHVRGKLVIRIAETDDPASGAQTGATSGNP